MFTTRRLASLFGSICALIILTNWMAAPDFLPDQAGQDQPAPSERTTLSQLQSPKHIPVRQTHDAWHAKLDSKINTRALDAYADLPLSFEINRGQADERVKFLSRGAGYNIFLTDNEAVLKIRNPRSSSPVSGRDTQSSVLRMRLRGASPSPRIEPLDEQQHKLNYFLGSNPA